MLALQGKETSITHYHCANVIVPVDERFRRYSNPAPTETERPFRRCNSGTTDTAT